MVILSDPWEVCVSLERGTLPPELDRALPTSGAYTYLPASVRRFPGAEALALQMEVSGFSDVRFRLLAGTIVALHTGVAAQRPSLP